MLRPTLSLAALLCGVVLRAHPELDQALQRLNVQIATTPANPDLYLDRGDLYARHGEWMMAEANYLRAADLAPEHPRLERALGGLALATQQPAQALRHLDRALARQPDDLEARLWRARAHAALKDRAAARADFDAALARIEQPSPELYLERAELAESAAEALRTLDAGLARIGPAVTLHLRALELEEELGRIDAALTRLDALAAQSERRDAWLKRRGDLLARHGRGAEARTAYAAALAAVDALPDWLRASPDTARLAAELRRLAARP